jgi:hypothetical protein
MILDNTQAARRRSTAWKQTSAPPLPISWSPTTRAS